LVQAGKGRGEGVETKKRDPGQKIAERPKKSGSHQGASPKEGKPPVSSCRWKKGSGTVRKAGEKP